VLVVVCDQRMFLHALHIFLYSYIDASYAHMFLYNATPLLCITRVSTCGLRMTPGPSACYFAGQPASSREDTLGARVRYELFNHIH
jgi:hypothetical protein